MKTLLLLLSLLLLFPLNADQKPGGEADKIERLIKHIEGLSGASFIRNGSDYDAKTAARFLRGKWQREERKITTATDFIDKVGTKSSTSGKPYLIRFKDGREIPCADYLREILAKQEKDASLGSSKKHSRLKSILVIF
jgi:hypothetical protein